MKVAKRVGYLLLFLTIGALMPVSILVAGGAAMRQKRRLSKLSASEGTSCQIDQECPPGFVCLNGRCVRAAS